MSVRDNRRFPEMLVHSLVTVIGECSAVICFQGFYQFPCQFAKLILLFVCYSLLMQLLRRFSPRGAFFCVLISFTMIPLLLLLHRDAAAVGIQTFYRMMSQTAMHEQVRYSYAAVVGEWSELTCMRFLFDVMAFAVAALLEYSDVLLSSRHSGRSGLFMRFLVTFPFLECGLYFGLETYPAAVFSLIAFWIASLALMQRRVKGLHPAEKQSIFAVKKSKQFTTHEISAAFLLLLTGLIGCAVVAGTANFRRSREMNQKRNALLDFYHGLSIYDATGILQSIPSQLGIHVEGDTIELDEIDRLNFNGAPALYVTVGASALSQDYYMRGLVRSEYTGSGWAVPTAAYRSGNELFQRLTDAGKMPQTYFIADEAEQLTYLTGKYRVINCSVQAVNPEHVNYLPYQVLCKEGTKYRHDSEIILDDTQNYDFWILKDYSFYWGGLVEQMPSSDPMVNEYEKFVLDTYLSFPENEAMEQIKNQFDQFLFDTYGLSLDDTYVSGSDLLDLICTYLWETCEYDTAPGKTPEGYDYADYFLLENHRGFCAHYATAAVLLCRMHGIPARYCQGYVLTQRNYTEAVSGEDYLYTIPDEQAHAWAEIYVESFGWVPYEFTESVAEIWHSYSPQTTQTSQVTASATTASSAQNSVTAASSQTTTTSAAAASSLPAGSSDDNGQHAGAAPDWLRTVLMTAGGAASLLLLLLLYRAFHYAVVRKRKAAMYQQNANAAADAAYQFLIKLLAIQGIRQGGMPHEVFADAAEAQCDLLPEGSVRRAVEIEQEAVFSRTGTSADAAAELSRTAEIFAQILCENAKPLRRFVLRWFRHVVA